MKSILIIVIVILFVGMKRSDRSDLVPCNAKRILIKYYNDNKLVGTDTAFSLNYTGNKRVIWVGGLKKEIIANKIVYSIVK